MVPAAFSVAGTCVLIGFGYSGAVPAVPGQLPVVPGQLPVVPGRLPVVPGRLPVVPGRLPVVPGRLSVVPGRLSVVLVRLLLSRPIPVVLRSFGYPVRFRIFPGWNRSCLPSQFAEKEPNVCAVPYFFIYLRVSFRAGGDLPIFVRL
ncbi:MAG: hypothetical protein ACLRXZ_10325 [Alistipes finegoldii]|uniref:hypothetical protein n=1 Tax=Alistipes finegoldii TaxID=214856 RepID=UPI0039A22BB5